MVLVNAARIIETGSTLINGDRQKDYGPPAVNFQAIADMWTVVFGKKVTPMDVVNAMICLKVCRGLQGFKEDTYVDIVGYAGLAGEMPRGR